MGSDVTCDHSVGNSGSKECLSSLLHLDQDHRTDLLWGEVLLLSLEVDSNVGLVSLLGNDLEWPVLHVVLADGVGEPISYLVDVHEIICR